jgi:hypothetical protein
MNKIPRTLTGAWDFCFRRGTNFSCPKKILVSEDHWFSLLVQPCLPEAESRPARELKPAKSYRFWDSPLVAA